MESVTWVQILDGVACASLGPYALEKGMNTSFLPPIIGKGNQSRRRKTLNSDQLYSAKNWPCVTSCSWRRDCLNIYICCIHIWYYIYYIWYHIWYYILTLILGNNNSKLLNFKHLTKAKVIIPSTWSKSQTNIHLYFTQVTSLFILNYFILSFL